MRLWRRGVTTKGGRRTQLRNAMPLYNTLRRWRVSKGVFRQKFPYLVTFLSFQRQEPSGINIRHRGAPKERDVVPRVSLFLL